MQLNTLACEWFFDHLGATDGALADSLRTTELPAVARDARGPPARA